MGGFVFIRRSAGMDDDLVDDDPAVQQMRRRKLVVGKVLRREEFSLYLYRKRRFSSSNSIEFENGNFIAATGTLLYRGMFGERALCSLFDDFCSDQLSFETLQGHFAVWIFVENRLILFNDYQGQYQVYHSSDYRRVSSSFLAVLAGCDQITPSPQEVYEYLAFSMAYGERTVVKEVYRLGRTHMVQLLPGRREYAKQIRLPSSGGRTGFEELLDLNHDRLSQVFQTYVDAFGDDISIGLSGGFDSRLVLAYLLYCGANPRIYVQGTEESADVKIARKVAAFIGRRIELDSVGTDVRFSPDEFPARLRAASDYSDGFLPSGLLTTWMLAAPERSDHVRPEKLRLYGMAGEMYRRTLALPSRRVTFSEFFTVQADKVDVSSFTSRFNKRDFYGRIGDKMKDAMQLQDRSLTPIQAEMAYPFFRLAFNSGWQMTVQNERAHAIVPFGEPLLSHAAAEIPMEFRKLGRMESALIARANPEIAAAPSAYGYSFSDGPSVRARLRAAINESIPIRLRPAIHRYRARRSMPPSKPYFLEDAYLGELFPDGCRYVSGLIDLRAESSPAILSRALTLEFLFSGRCASADHV